MNIDNTETSQEIEDIEASPVITYDEVRSQISRRWTFDMYKPTLEEAIKTEGYQHAQAVIDWKKLSAFLEEGEEAHPEPVIDLSVRREFYQDRTNPIADENLKIVSEEWVYDDINLTKHIKFVTEQILTDRELAEAESLSMYHTDRNISQQIILDYTLGIGGVTQDEFDSVREYMQSIEPIPSSSAKTIIAIVKPPVFDRYKSVR